MDDNDLIITMIEPEVHQVNTNSLVPRGCMVEVKSTGVTVIVPGTYSRSEIKIRELAVTLAMLSKQ